MARPLRLEYPGAMWHVTVRGNERRTVFRVESDRLLFLDLLARTIGLFRWRLRAYVLMGNHYHLLVETPEPTLSRGMRELNGVYTQAFNRRHGRVGHLFQGRFKSILVERESHLLELTRYVVLNPVRARLVRSAGAWRWSSYRATAGLEAAPSWLEVDAVLERFGRNQPAARKAFREFVAEGRDVEYDPWKSVKGQIFLGSDSFRRDLARRLKGRARAGGTPRYRPPVLVRKERIEAAVQETFDVSLETLREKTRTLVKERRILAEVLRTEGLIDLRTIGLALGVGAAQAGVLVRAGGELKDRALRDRLVAALTD